MFMIFLQIIMYRTGRPRVASATRPRSPRRGATGDHKFADLGTGEAQCASMCVQDADVQCVLQFRLIHAAGCALYRCTSRVIHRIELYFCTIQKAISRAVVLD